MNSALEPSHRRAVILLSGGLDSTLAARLLVELGIDLFAIHFTSPFCTCSNKVSGKGAEGGHGAGCHTHAQVVAHELKIPIHTVSKGKEYVEIVRNPRHGRGSAMNPCVDCRVFTLRKAREYMEEIGASFLVTGEVLGQRPMSQKGDTLRRIEKLAGCADLVLRPLSAQLLPPTIPEREGWVDREKLLAINGRGRKEQYRLAQEWNVNDFPCPAGGCLLTDRTYCIKVRDLLDHDPDPDMLELNLLKVGRHFRLPDGRKVIVAREEAGNRRLEALAKGRYLLFRAEGMPGPSVAISPAPAGAAGPTATEILAKVYGRYCKEGTTAPYDVREITAEEERPLLVPSDPDFSLLKGGLLA
jgi:hypothetical protein